MSFFNLLYKWGTDVMSANYEILRPVTPADLDVNPRFVKILKMIPREGHVTRDHFKSLETNDVNRCMIYAFSSGILKRVFLYERVLKFESVKFWCTQFNKTGHKRTSPNGSTKKMYLRVIAKFDEWLPGRSFQSHETVIRDGQMTKQPVTKSFASVENLLYYCTESEHGTKTARRAIREYLAGPEADKMSDSVHSITRAAIKSYFNVNDVVLNIPKSRKKLIGHTHDDDPMTLEDFYHMLKDGNPGLKMKTVMLIKLHSGMDSSTFADRFNYEGYSQITKHFGTDDHKSWNLEKCPVPIKLVRVKTNVQYTTFLERDAITQLQRYLTWKDTKYGKHDPSKPLFVTQRGVPIDSAWISRHFSEVAVRAGMQEKVSPMVYKMRAHSVRHLLKSTLIRHGCKSYVADHVLGHAPKDTYERQAVLYPEALRAEYAKASPYINIFSKVESILNTADDPASLHARIRELEAKVKSSKQFKTEMNMTEETDTGVINDMQKKLDKVLSILDALPDDTKKQIAEKLEDSDDED